MILHKLYVPSNCLQGAELPVHILWSKDTKIALRMETPMSFEILNVYNAEVADTKEVQDIRVSSFTKFEENGYLGIILKCPQLKEHASDQTILFEALDSEGNSQREKRSIHLFRPSIKIISVPPKMGVKHQRYGIVVKDRIAVANDGEGLGIVGFNVLEDSQLKISQPEGAKEFSKSFWSDWSVSLQKLKSSFPGRADLINKIISLGTAPPQMGAEWVKRLRGVYEELENVLQSDSTFADEFVKSLVVAYMRNLHIMTEVESFATYLKSIEPNRIIIENAIGVLNVGRQPKKFKAELVSIDLGLNSYPEIPVEVELVAEKDCEVPVYKLLNVGRKKGVEKSASIR